MSETDTTDTDKQQNNYYEADTGWEVGWDTVIGYIVIGLCVIALIVAAAFLVLRLIDFSKRVDIEHEKTQQVRIQTCQGDDNVRLCIVKTEE